MNRKKYITLGFRVEALSCHDSMWAQIMLRSFGKLNPRMWIMYLLYPMTCEVLLLVQGYTPI